MDKTPHYTSPFKAHKQLSSPVDSRVCANCRNGRPHIPQIPDLHGAVITARNDVISHGEHGGGHSAASQEHRFRKSREVQKTDTSPLHLRNEHRSRCQRPWRGKRAAVVSANCSSRPKPSVSVHVHTPSFSADEKTSPLYSVPPSQAMERGEATGKHRLRRTCQTSIRAHADARKFRKKFMPTLFNQNTGEKLTPLTQPPPPLA